MTDFEQKIYRNHAVSTEGTLFETFADRVMRRVDDVIAGRNCAWPASQQQRQLLELLRGHQGKLRAVALNVIGERMQLAPRAVKGLVQDLRTSFGVQLGASRSAEGGGYYIVATEEESDETTAQMRSQAITMLCSSHSMRRDRESIAQLLQQVEMQLSKEVA